MPYLILFFLELLLIFKLSRILIQKLFNLFYKVTKNQKLTIYIIAIIFLPGTFVHEMAHFIFALFLLVRTGHLELVPQTEGRGVKMGSLQIAKTDILRRNLIGIAPMVLGTAIIFSVLYFVTKGQTQLFYLILSGILIFQISNTMYSSKKDLELALPLIIILVMLVTIFYLLKINIPINLVEVINTPKLISLLKLADLYLLLPVFLNSTLILPSLLKI